jgi:hypothetical protein
VLEEEIREHMDRCCRIGAQESCARKRDEEPVGCRRYQLVGHD